MKKTPARLRNTLALLAIIAITFCAAIPGFFFPPAEWYASLNKPAWNPPGWLFGPVWTTIYLMMALAAWLIWKQKENRSALRAYSTQLLLNASWTPVFFGAHRIGLALFIIILLWCAILITILEFRRLNKAASYLLLPYLAWVSFATFLNFTLWRMNPA